jgi:hypothetical protein
MIALLVIGLLSLIGCTVMLISSAKKKKNKISGYSTNRNSGKLYINHDWRGGFIWHT